MLVISFKTNKQILHKTALFLWLIQFLIFYR